MESVRSCKGADWLFVEPKEEDTLPTGLALRALREHPDWDANDLLGKVTVDEALDSQTEALGKLFKEVHALQSAPLEEIPLVSEDKVAVYEDYLNKLAITFSHMPLEKLVSACSQERLEHLRDLEYEYPELISRALTLKLTESKGTLSYNGKEPLSRQFVKDLLFAIQKYEDFVHLDFPNCNWEEGALAILKKGLTKSPFTILNLNSSE